MKINAIIIEDETPARVTIKSYLKKYFPDIRVVGEAGRIAEALEILESISFDFIFLDVQLKDGLGIDLLKTCKKRCKRVIFTTAFDNYAMDAFKHKAFGYLLKPIDPIDFKEIVERVIKDVLVTHVRPAKVKVPTSHGFAYIDSAEIIRCESESNYSRIYTQNGKNYLISKTLKIIEKELLPNAGFARVHQSHLINLRYIDMDRIRHNQMELKSGETIPISRSRREDFQVLLRNFLELPSA